MFNYEKGKIYTEAIGHVECVMFDIADDGATIAVYFDSPTQEEKSAFRSGSSLDVRHIRLHDTLMFLFRFGNLNWMDAPYTPHLSINLSKIAIPNEGEGLATMIFLFDTRTGRLEETRLVSFSEKYTRKLLGDVIEMKSEPFSPEAYFANLNSVYSRFTTKDLLKMAKPGFRI